MPTSSSTAFEPPQTFIQPNAGQQHNAAMLGSLVPLMAALPAEAAGDPGPLAGSEICNNLLGLSLIAPLCNTIWLADPVYQFPLFGVIIASIVLPLQLLIPALQPDEDLRN